MRYTRKYYGKEQEKFYEFDPEAECIIYKCVCGEKLKTSEWSKLKEEHRFSRYCEWKQYVYNKYENASKEKLEEFYRFLEQKKRLVNMSHMPQTVVWPVLLTLAMTYFVDIIKVLEQETSKWNAEAFKWVMLFGLMSTILILISCVVLWGFPYLVFLTAVKRDLMRENLYKDYQEIIAELIAKKEEIKNKSKKEILFICEEDHRSWNTNHKNLKN